MWLWRCRRQVLAHHHLSPPAAGGVGKGRVSHRAVAVAFPPPSPPACGRGVLDERVGTFPTATSPLLHCGIARLSKSCSDATSHRPLRCWPFGAMLGRRDDHRVATDVADDPLHHRHDPPVMSVSPTGIATTANKDIYPHPPHGMARLALGAIGVVFGISVPVRFMRSAKPSPIRTIPCRSTMRISWASSA